MALSSCFQVESIACVPEDDALQPDGRRTGRTGFTNSMRLWATDWCLSFRKLRLMTDGYAWALSVWTTQLPGFARLRIPLLISSSSLMGGGRDLGGRSFGGRKLRYKRPPPRWRSP